MTAYGGHLCRTKKDFAVAAEKESREGTAKRNSSTNVQKSVNFTAKVLKKQSPKVTTTLEEEFESKIVQGDDTESFKAMMKDMMSKSNLDTPKESKNPKVSYERRKNEVLSSIEELKEVSKTIGSSASFGAVDAMQPQDHKRFLQSSLEQMEKAENMRHSSPIPRRSIRITKQPKRLAQDSGIGIVDDTSDIDIDVNFDDINFHNITQEERRGEEGRGQRGQGLSDNEINDFMRMISKTTSSRDSSAAVVREVEELFAGVNDDRFPEENAESQQSIFIDPRSSLTSMEERNEERRKENRLRMYAAFDEVQPEYEGLLCPKCNSPCDDEEMNDFGKCTFCRQIDLRDPSVHKLQHYDNTFASSNSRFSSNLNTNTANIKKSENIVDIAQRQQLEQQRKEQQERLFSSSYSPSFPKPNMKDESRVLDSESNNLLIAFPNKSAMADTNVKLEIIDKNENSMLERSNVSSDNNNNNNNNNSNVNISSINNKKKNTSNKNRNDRLDTDLESQETVKLRELQIQEELNMKGKQQRNQQQQQQNLRSDAPLLKQGKVGYNQYKEDDYHISSSSSSSSSSVSSFHDIEDERYSDHDTAVSERFSVFERQLNELSETLDIGVFDRIEDLDKISVQLMRVRTISLLTRYHDFPHFFTSNSSYEYFVI